MTEKLWRVLAQYPDDGGVWSDDVSAETYEGACDAARREMTNNARVPGDELGDDEEPDDGIVIIDCDPVDEKMRAKDNAVELLALVKQQYKAINDLMPGIARIAVDADGIRRLNETALEYTRLMAKVKGDI